jgi:hypothetical protein
VTRRLALLLVALAALPAHGQEAPSDFDRGVAAIDRKEWAAAIEALERARARSPERADVLYNLARAFEGKGAASDALHCYGAAARLDPAGVGPKAKSDAWRLRKRWLAVELEEGDLALRSQDYAPAGKAYLRAFELMVDEDGDRPRAREGYASACAGELVHAALEGAPAGTAVAVQPIEGRGIGGSHELMTAVVERALIKAFVAAGAAVIDTTTHGAVSRAAIVVDGTASQTILLRARDARGVVKALEEVRILREGRGTLDLPPDRVSLELRIEAERDAGKTTQSVPVAEGATLLSGDRFRIRARARAPLPVHFYAFIFDSEKRVTLLYPGTENLFPELAKAGCRSPNPIRSDGELVVPPRPAAGADLWFFLDEKPGRETFYVAASLEPLADLDGIVAQLKENSAEGDTALRIARILEARAEESQVAKGAAGEEITARGAAVRYLSIEHRAR